MVMRKIVKENPKKNFKPLRGPELKRQVGIRLSDEEFNEILAAAYAQQRTVSNYLRLRLFPEAGK